MKSGIKDKNGVEVKEKDIIALPYITPHGTITEDEDQRVVVVYEHGCFGYYDKVRFNTLMDWQKTEEGEYVPNAGEKTIYTGKYYFWIVAE
tara:strand:+ start:233 stop:505 length:273 start_codon:yes stop_codon:yes gene_type:complete